MKFCIGLKFRSQARVFVPMVAVVLASSVASASSVATKVICDYPGEEGTPELVLVTGLRPDQSLAELEDLASKSTVLRGDEALTDEELTSIDSWFGGYFSLSLDPSKTLVASYWSCDTEDRTYRFQLADLVLDKDTGSEGKLFDAEIEVSTRGEVDYSGSVRCRGLSN